MTADSRETIITFHSTGKRVEPNPWDGVQFHTAPDGTRTVLSHTLPSAAFILIPVFVTSSHVTIDVINYLLESSWAIRIQAQPIPQEEYDNPAAYRSFEPRLILPPLRDPQFLLSATDWPVSPHDLMLPFLGYSVADVLAAWLGTDQASVNDGVAAFRTVHGGAVKSRHWSTNCFLILDEQTMAEGDEPTALLMFLSSGSSDETKVETVRCELPVTLRFMLGLLGGDEPLMRYFKDNVVGEDGILRSQEYADWFRLDGPADKEWAEGRLPELNARVSVK